MSGFNGLIPTISSTFISTPQPIKTGGAIIEVENISTRFKALYTPESANRYAGILNYGKSLILYGFYSQEHSKTWRRI